ncbi:hypothetical protein [Streptomyces sp. NPDC127190]
MAVPPPERDDRRRAALLAVASHCTGRNPLERHPAVAVEPAAP